MNMRISRELFLSAFMVLAVFKVIVAPASATLAHHEKIGSFTGSDGPGRPFGLWLCSDAVDQANGDVYVTESEAFGIVGPGHNVVDKFDEAGKYAGVQIAGAKIPGQ